LNENRPVAAHARLGRLRHQVADLGKELRVGCGIGARRPADRRLIDVDDFVDVLESVDAIVCAWGIERVEEMAR
jgi:hypothetical protein